MLNFDLEKAFTKVRHHADWIGLRYVKEKTSTRTVRNDLPERFSTHFDEGVMVEVLINGHFGYAGTDDLSTAGIERALNHAISLTRHASNHKVFPFSTAQRPRAVGRYFSPRQKSFDSISLAEMTDFLVRTTKAMKISDKIVNRESSAMIIETSLQQISSSGTDLNQDFSMAALDFSSTASEGTETQFRNLNSSRGICKQVGAEVFELSYFLPRCEQISQEALELVVAENCPTGIMDVILAPDQMTLQIHESIGHPLELDRILGDERNYAGWSFVKPSDFGQLQYGSKLMNITFDPTVPGEFASYAFDESGNPATKEYLIKDGLLQRGLGSLESQARSHLPGVANFRSASWNRAPIDRMANINLEPGQSSLAEMISSIEKGVMMMANRSWSIDDYRQKFQFGCEYAKLIENGQLTRTLKNPNYRGISVPFWNKLSMIGRKEEGGVFGSPWCGKGEPQQVIRVGHASPWCKFDQIEVFGGHA